MKGGVQLSELFGSSEIKSKESVKYVCFFRNKFRVGGKLLEKRKVNQDFAKLGLGGGLGSVWQPPPPSLSTKGVENLNIFNISMYILCTVFYTFPKELTMRICIKIKSFLSC